MKLLIIEDEKKIRDFLKVALESEYFVVDTAEDGEEGFSMAQLNNYDTIILDNKLPNKTGLEICTDLRASGQMTPIILLSAQSEISNKVTALNAGADDYLTKPFSITELIARIRALFRRPQQVERDILTAYNITLDTIQHVVTKEGREITLTKKEFMLLEYFMRNYGSVLSRGMIMEHVWDMNADPFSNTIESHILNLRKKIKSESENNLIKTIPGIGYKFSVE